MIRFIEINIFYLFILTKLVGPVNMLISFPFIIIFHGCCFHASKVFYFKHIILFVPLIFMLFTVSRHFGEGNIQDCVCLQPDLS